MYESLGEEELESLISSYQTYKSLAQSMFTNNKYHAFRSDGERIIKMCDDNLVLLFTVLKNKHKE
jgi:hypothetical protein